MHRTGCILLMIVLLLNGCASGPPPEPADPTPTHTQIPRLTPFYSPTPSATPSPIPVTATITPLPSPTLTPRTHEVQKGEDLFGIALRYGVSLEAIKTANPTVNPQFLSIGTDLTIPPGEGPTPTLPAPEAAAVTPTPIPVDAPPPHCLLSREGGAWCFLLVHNTHDVTLENLSALIHLAGGDNGEIQTLPAFLPLDLLPPGARMPLVAYFPPPQAALLQAGAEVLTSLPQPGDDGRYLPVRVEDVQVALEEGGRSAAVTLGLALDTDEATAGTVRVAVVAYDAAGQVVGVRRWENDTPLTLSRGAVLPVALRVYPVAGRVDHVEVFAEARP